VGAVVWYAEAEPAPPRYICAKDGKQSEVCEEMQPGGEIRTYYVTSRAKNEAAGRDAACWGRIDEEIEEWVPADYQVRNATFSPARDCIVRESLYWTMQDIGAFQIYQFMCAVAIIFTTVLGFIGFVFPGGFIFFIHGLTSLGLFAATVMAIVLLSWWSFLWGVSFLFHLLFFLSDRWRIANASQILLHVNTVVRRQPVALLFTLWNSALQMGWFIGWGYVYITVNGRLTGWLDALLFLIYLWFANVFATIHFTTISGVVASWYFSKRGLSSCLRSVLRCVTLSFGSMCYGSFFLTIGKLLKVAVNYSRVSRNGLIQLLGAFIAAAEQILGGANTYGLGYISIYGNGYRQASAKGYDSIAHSGLQASEMSDVMTGVSVAGSLLMGLTCVASTWFVTHYHEAAKPGDEADLLATMYIPAFVLGVASGVSFVLSAEAAMTTLYLCFSEEPESLKLLNKDLHMIMCNMWFDSYLDEASDGSGDDAASDQSISDISILSDEAAEGRAKAKALALWQT